eukprot:3037232-Prymnesium_polylepis.1
MAGTCGAGAVQERPDVLGQPCANIPARCPRAARRMRTGARRTVRRGPVGPWPPGRTPTPRRAHRTRQSARHPPRCARPAPATPAPRHAQTGRGWAWARPVRRPRRAGLRRCGQMRRATAATRLPAAVRRASARRHMPPVAPAG